MSASVSREIWIDTSVFSAARKRLDRVAADHRRHDGRRRRVLGAAAEAAEETLDAAAHAGREDERENDDDAVRDDEMRVHRLVHLSTGDDEGHAHRVISDLKRVEDEVEPQDDPQHSEGDARRQRVAAPEDGGHGLACNQHCHAAVHATRI